MSEALNTLWERLEREYAPIHRIVGRHCDPAPDPMLPGEDVVTWANRVIRYD
jgi:hypothetical protein